MTNRPTLTERKNRSRIFSSGNKGSAKKSTHSNEKSSKTIRKRSRKIQNYMNMPDFNPATTNLGTLLNNHDDLCLDLLTASNSHQHPSNIKQLKRQPTEDHIA